MKCEKCGNIVEDKYIWCPVCGTKRPKDNPEDKNIERKEENYSLEQISSNQNLILKDDYCTNCGSRLQYGFIYCPSCGNKIKYINKEYSKYTCNVLKFLNIFVILYCVLSFVFTFWKLDGNKLKHNIHYISDNNMIFYLRLFFMIIWCIISRLGSKYFRSSKFFKYANMMFAVFMVFLSFAFIYSLGESFNYCGRNFG